MKTLDNRYKKWLTELKSKIRSSQIKAALAVNSALIGFYWDLGKMIAEQENVYSGKLIDRVSKDLRAEFPTMKGLSVRNLNYCRTFYQFYTDPILQQVVAKFQSNENQEFTILQQLVAQIPWGHNILIFSKSKDYLEALFYIKNTIEHSWSRQVLEYQMQSDLFGRQGKSVNNFKSTLPAPRSELAEQIVKDPYVLDFLSLDANAREADIEMQLIEHITRFMLELGKGFAFVGRQVKLVVDGKEYFVDLLFYHIRLKCFVVVELKNTEFMPEYVGKLNFYLSAIDDRMKGPDDHPSIGILLCKGKSTIAAEFSLRDIQKPMGVTAFQLTSHLPEHLKNSFPSIEEMEQELSELTKGLTMGLKPRKKRKSSS